jgi:probable F420-dependent oxidoreductase
MKFGLYGINVGPCADPEVSARVARAAEEAGFDSLWTAEHVVLPDPQVPPSPVGPREKLLDPLASLAFLAAQTTRVKLATGIVILPQRNPVVLAKELASVDVLSRGRLVFGIGAGYLEPEFRAIGADFESRGARADEYLEAILELWTGEPPAYRGETIAFEGIDAHPRPLQRPHPPIVVGGYSPPALRRAQRFGDGWYGFLRTPEMVQQDLAGLARAAGEVDRNAARGALEISVTPPPGLDAAGVAAYAEAGVQRLVLLPITRSGDELVRFVEEAGENLVRKLA